MRTTELDRAVYAIVSEEARQGRRATVSKVQRETGAARSSVYRVAQHYGYDTWLDFTASLERYFRRVGSGDMVSKSVRAVADMILRNQGLPILLDSVGDVAICSDYLQYRLAEQGYVALTYTKSIAQAWRRDKGSGLVIAFNESGMALLPTCLAAIENGFATVAITSSHDTPISKICDLNVVIKNNKSPLSSYEPNLLPLARSRLLSGSCSTCAWKAAGRRARASACQTGRPAQRADRADAGTGRVGAGRGWPAWLTARAGSPSYPTVQLLCT